MNINNYDSEIIDAENSAPQEAIDCFKKAEHYINLLVSSKNIEDPLNALPRLAWSVSKDGVEQLNAMLKYVSADHPLYQLEAAKLFNLITVVQNHWSKLWVLAIKLKNERFFDEFSKNNPELAINLREHPCGEESPLLAMFKESMKNVSLLSFTAQNKKEFDEYFEKTYMEKATSPISSNSGCMVSIAVIISSLITMYFL